MVWISIKDRLPDKNMRCLCAIERYNRILYDLYYFSTNLYEVDNMDFCLDFTIMTVNGAIIKFQMLNIGCLYRN